MIDKLSVFIVAISGREITYSIEKVKNLFSKVSFDTLYQVTFPSANYNNWLRGSNIYWTDSLNEGFRLFEKVGLLCTQAELPGTQYQTTQVIGDRQGLIEMFPVLRTYPPLNLTFYVDTNHIIIKVFEVWMNYINPLNSARKQDNTYSRMRYPDTYKDFIKIVKFEKDTGLSDKFMKRQGLEKRDVRELRYKSSMLNYEFVNAWPSNIISMPVSYGTSNILKVSVTFQYDRYYVSESTAERGFERMLFNERNILNAG